MLLERCPQFADQCDWEKLDDDDWKGLLMFNPQFESIKKELDEKRNAAKK